MSQTAAATPRDLPGILVDTADVPGGGCLQLVRYGDHHEILFGDEQLMGSWDYRSEEALATLVVGRLGRGAQRVLIGGLGMGFTLGAALAALPADSTVVVAELVPKVVAWAEGPLAELFGNALDDARVSLLIRDVHDVIVDRQGGFDAILLDVDNGPEGLISLANERLYCDWGLRAMRAALRPHGMLAIWSAYQDDPFARRLGETGFAVEEVSVDAGDPSDPRPHTIWLATRTD